ncbi:WD repeat protein [Tieghemostelium lacteum]|uniref:WD repeat protein n=1 Tax=Tieghemostelium lacteum TaxID=361077 RepID=A0A152A4D7_TIELA|nr:WD repeat protein [Tieghemostelium lacteum]|eukprot:KYR01089.1 WD repeat protein [Tieghemostelium lacteum]
MENSVNSNENSNGVLDYTKSNNRISVDDENNLVSCYFNKNEMVRLLVQSLHSLGYKNSAELLEKESGVSLQTKEIAQFSQCILGGEWNKIESLIPYLNLQSKDDLNSVKFLIYSQKYLELIDKKNVKEALVCLRSEITPISTDPHKLQTLTSLIMCSNAQQIESKKKEICIYNNSTSKTLSRVDLLNNIRKYVSSEVLLPEKRLEHLIKESIQHQIGKCLYHNTNEPYISLFKDHVCSKDQMMPSEARFTLKDKHRDEVWFIKFSHNGLKLASCSKDNLIIIWDMSGVYKSNPIEPKPLHILQGHTKEVSYLAWSPDDQFLLSASYDHNIKLWNMNGQCLRTFSKHTEAISSCIWHPDGKRFFSGGMDRYVHLWSIGDLDHLNNNNNNNNNNSNGNNNIAQSHINNIVINSPLTSWCIARVNDLSVTRDGSQFIVICQEKKIRIYDIDTTSGNSPICIPETDAITSMELSNDGHTALINISASQEIHLWDLDKKTIIQKYRGQKQGRFVIRSCFGGADEAFVLSGSEDHQIYVWHRQSGTLLETLPGHTGTVNCVCWSPISPYLFCSASDDHTIKVWTRPFDSSRLDINNNNNTTSTPPSKNNHKRNHE